MLNTLNLLVSVSCILFYLSVAYAAVENLDEMERRKARRATHTYYSGASIENDWERQPETFMYTDIKTGHEVWVLSSTPNNSNIYYTDISPANPWSADGAMLGFFSNRSVEAFPRYQGSILDGDKASAFVVHSDGSFLRVAEGAANRSWGTLGMKYFWWSPVLPDTFYSTGESGNGRELDKNSIYKNMVSNTGISFKQLIDVFPGDTSSGFSLMKKVISPDGTTLIGQNGKYPSITFWPMTIYPEESAGLLDPDGWLEQRGQTDQWAGGEPFACKHDVYLPSKDFMVLLFSYDCNSISPVFYKYDISGSDTDGGPKFISSEKEYATFGSFETEPLWAVTPTRVPWKLEPDNNMHWWGHPGFDRWGRIVIYNDSNGYWQNNGKKEWGGPVAWDYVNRRLVAEPKSSYPKVLITKRGTYIDFNAWSDFFAYGAGARSEPDGEKKIFTAEYNKTHEKNDIRTITYHHGDRNSGSYWWKNSARVAQSPDGTKISYALTFLTDNPKAGDLAYTVAYYPHPPEITSVQNGIITFSWYSDGISRGYTQRGWPNEDTALPPPPRETHYFRLWKSPNGSGNWTPIATVNAEIFDRYDFSTGQWKGPKDWEITDTSPSGFYAVTAVEHSGLESRTLSNIVSARGIQFSGYPPQPKNSNQFYTSPPEAPQIQYVTQLPTPGQYRIQWSQSNSPLLRYYNIYYSTKGVPEATVRYRIASLPSSNTTYVDWLAATDKPAFYTVTAVDSQGNESLLPTSKQDIIKPIL